MFSQYAHKNDVAYGIITFILDSEDDLRLLPTDLKAGSKAMVIDTSKCYVLNHLKEWIEVESSFFNYWETLVSTGGGKK